MKSENSSLHSKNYCSFATQYFTPLKDVTLRECRDREEHGLGGNHNELQPAHKKLVFAIHRLFLRTQIISPAVFNAISVYFSAKKEK